MAHEVLIAREGELRDAVKLDLGAVAVVEKAFAALSRGDVVMPPILSMNLPEVHGEVEFDAWRWEDLAAVPPLIIPWKRHVYDVVAREFGRFARV